MLREHDNFELIDIRTRAEVERGVLPGARTLPMHMVPLKLAYFAESRKQIVVYCRTGSRSAQVCRFLSQQGIHNAISLRGGLVRWTASGYPLDPRASGAIA
ncbi:MAG: rhodanese-like domain-containing protein [Gammaproteobacteria bacterium]